jgi:hypothetical protein
MIVRKDPIEIQEKEPTRIKNKEIGKTGSVGLGSCI